MTIDERLERLTERLQFVTKDIESLRALAKLDSEKIRALARIAEAHKHRNETLEGGAQPG